MELGMRSAAVGGHCICSHGRRASTSLKEWKFSKWLLQKQKKTVKFFQRIWQYRTGTGIQTWLSMYYAVRKVSTCRTRKLELLKDAMLLPGRTSSSCLWIQFGFRCLGCGTSPFFSCGRIIAIATYDYMLISSNITNKLSAGANVGLFRGLVSIR